MFTIGLFFGLLHEQINKNFFFKFWVLIFFFFLGF